jgi:orotidine-5'-phosphate decarboxylase
MVRARARIAARAGIAGLVCSPHEIEAARGAAPGLFIVVPGIRPASGPGQAHGDQKRVATAAQAMAAGADYLVVGRPVRDAPDPAAAFEGLVAEVEAETPAP